ncbi:MAG TPA: hypothetical protein VIG52_08435 [Methyloceanibacter sp.]
MPIRGLLLGAVVLVAPAAPALAAGDTDRQATKCLKAEVNPVTGHVVCIDPLGASVEAPPSDALSPCQPLKHDGDFTYAPNCKDKPSG